MTEKTSRFRTASPHKAGEKEWLKGRNKFVTGFCSIGSHEGTRPFSASGEPMKVCSFYDTCPCTCHMEIDQMYEMAGLPRDEPEQTPEYRAKLDRIELETTLMLESVYRDRWGVPSLSSTNGTHAHPDDERMATGTPSASAGPLSTDDHGTVEPRFTSTPTGRRARGQLEFDVLKICDEYTRDVYEWDYCTPKLVAEAIGKMHATEPPSTGAINAVWDRWERLGFAVQDKKPSRFVRFEVNSNLQTLEMLKAKAKRDKRRVQADVKRGSLRPRGR